MRTDVLKKALHGEMFALYEKDLHSLTDFLNSGAEATIDYNGASKDDIAYEVFDSKAIISVDGAMYKKGFTGLCSSVFGYNNIINMIQQAENDQNVNTIVFVVDSPGGSVDGVEQLADRVRTSPKKTITYYDNKGLSAAIWGFIGADKVYASPTTMIGSIGVVGLATFEKGDDNRIVVLSEGAENKVCDSMESCVSKIQKRVSRVESIFYDTIQQARPDFTPDKIRSVFNNGDMIFADEALWNGFIDGVVSLKTLFEKEI